MAMDSEQRGIRKSIYVTTSVGLVLWLNGWATDDYNIHWMINLKGWLAWGFLLVAHLYFSLMWRLQGHISWYTGKQDTISPETVRRPEFIHRKDLPLFGVFNPHKSRVFVARQMTDLVAILGGIMIAMNFFWSLYILWSLDTTGIQPMSVSGFL